MPAEMLGGSPPPIKYVIVDGDSGLTLGECSSVDVTGVGVVTLVLKDAEWSTSAVSATAGAAIPTPAEIIEQLAPSFDMFDLLRSELADRGWQPDTAESIAADVARSFLNDIMKKATA